MYVIDDLEYISKQEYGGNTGDDFMNLKFDADSIYLNSCVKRIKKGKITSGQMKAIKLYLSSNSD